MEQSEDQIVRLQICQKCYQHHQYDIHSQIEYQQNYEKFVIEAGLLGLKIVRNVAPKYLTKAPNTKNSTKRHIDTNTGKMAEFPAKGSFQVYFKNILIYSKLENITFPDLNYMCMLLKVVKKLCLANPSILDGLERFRHVQYEWNKKSMHSQSLYNYVKQNACGNVSERCAIEIILSFVSRNAQQTSTIKRKIIHPYILYDNKEKKSKIESIYCHKTPISQFLSHRPTNSNLTSHHITNKQLSLKKRPQTGIKIRQVGKQNDQEIKLKNNHACTQRQAGSIVKNYSKNNIFELVVKQQNKTYDDKKLKKWLKQQKIALSDSDNQLSQNKVTFRKKINRIKQTQNIHVQPLDTTKGVKKQNTLKLWSLSKCKRQKSSLNKDIYLQYLSNLKEKNKVINNKLHINFQTSRKMSQDKNGSRSSRRQNYIGQCKQYLRLQQPINSAEFKNCQSNQLIGDLNQFCNNGETDKNANIKDGQGHQNDLRNVDEFELLVDDGVNLLDENKENSPKKHPINQKLADQNEGIQKSPKTNSELDKTFSQQQKQDSQFKLQDSRVRRASIEQLTVKKRINERKRSSNHERHPHNSLFNLKFNSLKMDEDYGKDTIIADYGDQNCIYDEISCQREWEIYRNSLIYVRQAAQIVKKFAQEKNFINYNSYSSKYIQLMKQPQSPEVQFTITGQQLVHKFEIKSLRTMSKPTQIRLFPQIFKQIQLNKIDKTQQIERQKQKQKQKQHYYQSSCTNKLIHVVNLMLRSNPMMITRLFQDKKFINPYGVYCVWLKNCIVGRFQPVFVNDCFAFQPVADPAKTDRLKMTSRIRFTGNGGFKPVYSWLSHENSIWYMLLEKAVAKVVGGYHAINQLSLAQLMSLLMGSPTVDIGFINPQKAVKVFDQRVFYNKMASMYTLRQNCQQNNCSSELKQGRRIDRIIGFSYNKKNPRQSAVNIKIQQSTLTVFMSQFLLNYGQVCLLFFNNSYFLNQTPLPFVTPKQSVISCRLMSTHSKNNCYLIFSCFSEKNPTKVTLYRQLTDEEAGVTEGMNPLSEENKRYEYIGEIHKIGNFFFEVQINGGNYICLMENAYQNEPFLSIFSEFPIEIGEIKCHDISEKQRQKMMKKKTKKNEGSEKSSLNQSNLMNEDENETPKVLIERRVNFSKSSQKQSENKSVRSRIKIKKQYAYQPDNFYQIDEKEQDKQNESVTRSKSGGRKKHQIHNKYDPTQ